jgi:putative ABC transport system permease protein
MDMLQTWLIAAWRNFLKRKSFSIINISGLSLGIACLISILLYVLDELSYDKFHEKAERIYQINVTSAYDGSSTRYATTSTPLADGIRSDVPEAEEVARLFGRQATIQLIDVDSTVSRDKKYFEDNFFFADPSIIKIFSFNFLVGDPKSAMATPNQIVLTERIALKYFDSVEGAIGKQLLFEGAIPLEVSAVVADYPEQSTHQIELLSNFENYYNIERPDVRDFLRRDWLYNPVSTYVLLKEGTRLSDATQKINALNKKYADDRVREHVSYELQPFTDVHLYSDFTYASDRNAVRRLYLFSTIGILILLIACINFVNLSTVHSLRRAKEIGIRKVVGALKSGLTMQFLFESIVMVSLSFIVAFALVYFSLPFINSITGKNLLMGPLLDFEIVLTLLIIFITTALAAGAYPALHVSKFNPIAALKGLKDPSISSGFMLRRILVVTQFTASIVLIIFTVVVFRQVNFMQNKPLGFQRDFILTIPLFSTNPNSVLGGGIDGPMRARMNSFENELTKYSAVEAVTVSSGLPGQGVVNALVTTDKIKEADNVFVPIVSVDYDFIETFKMPVIAGRAFSKEAGTDHLSAFVANEEAVKRLGFVDPEKAIDQNIGALGKTATIIGVIRNYHFEGLQQPLRPLLMEVSASKFDIFSLRLRNNNIPETIEQVKKVWDTFFPEKVFEYEFLDDRLRAGYQREQQFGKLINVFSGLAIFISALGLFGLAAYLGHQKQKEAGIRKVLGATTAQIFYTLSKEFVRIIVLSVSVSIPLGYFFANSWLDDFANKIAVGWLPFAISFGCIGVIVFLTTAYQTLKTASINPVQTIRNE